MRTLLPNPRESTPATLVPPWPLAMLSCPGVGFGRLGGSVKYYVRLSLMLVLVCLAAACAPERAKYSTMAESEAKNRRQAILAEIKKLHDQEWAGEYYAGDGLGVNTSMVIAPKSGCEFEWHGCMGLYDRNYGSVTWTNGRIRLSFTFKNRRQGFQGVAPELTPVFWGTRHYLIPADDLVGFCNTINEGREPRNDIHGSYFLRRGDESKVVTGFPEVPVEYHHYLLAKPVEATIIAVGRYTTRPSVTDWKFKDTPVTIDAGTQQGLHAGMEFFVTKPLDTMETIQIFNVEKSISEGVMIQIGEGVPGPKVGWLLSTRAPWNPERTK